jgi:hypothetical protein
MRSDLVSLLFTMRTDESVCGRSDDGPRTVARDVHAENFGVTFSKEHYGMERDRRVDLQTGSTAHRR